MTHRIAPLSEDDAPVGARETLRRTREAIGMVPNLHRTLAHAPAALSAYVAMNQALAGGVLSPALRERLAVSIAARNGCQYCASAHTLLGKGAGLDADELAANLRGESRDARAQAGLRFAHGVLESRGAVSDADLAAVREAGYSEPEIVEIVAHVALNNFTNTFNVLARTEIDFPVVELPQVG